MNMKKIYKKIAKEHGVSVAEVKRDMQEAINAAYTNPNSYANCVKRKMKSQRRRNLLHT